MSAVFNTILPMLALIAVGFAAARFHGFTLAMGHGLSRYLSHYALPAILFVSMARARIPDPISWEFLASFYVAALLVFALGAAWMRWRRRDHDTVPVGLASSFSNIGQIGLPVIMEAYGPDVAVPVMLLIVFQSPLLITVATTLAESQRASGDRRRIVLRAARATLQSPLVWSVAGGFLFNLAGFRIPAVIDGPLDLLARTAMPCACFSAGAALAFGRLGGGVATATLMAGMKTVLHPLLTWLIAAKLFALGPEWAVPAVTAAALPIGLNAYSFAERYQAGRELVSLSLLLSTIASPLTISLAFSLSAR